MLTDEEVAAMRQQLAEIERGLAEGLRGPITVKWEHQMVQYIHWLLQDREDRERSGRGRPP